MEHLLLRANSQLYLEDSNRQISTLILRYYSCRTTSGGHESTGVRRFFLLLGSDNRILVLQQHFLRLTTERENELMAKKWKTKTASGKLTFEKKTERTESAISEKWVFKNDNTNFRRHGRKRALYRWSIGSDWFVIGSKYWNTFATSGIATRVRGGRTSTTRRRSIGREKSY